jgi:hypothetical protein
MTPGGANGRIGSNGEVIMSKDIVTNVSDLSHAMRSTLISKLQPWGDGQSPPYVLTSPNQATLDALEHRGLVTQVGPRWKRYATLTEAGERVRDLLINGPAEAQTDPPGVTRDLCAAYAYTAGYLLETIRGLLAEGEVIEAPAEKLSSAMQHCDTVIMVAQS